MGGCVCACECLCVSVCVCARVRVYACVYSRVCMRVMCTLMTLGLWWRDGDAGAGDEGELSTEGVGGGPLSRTASASCRRALQ